MSKKGKSPVADEESPTVGTAVYELLPEDAVQKIIDPNPCPRRFGRRSVRFSRNSKPLDARAAEIGGDPAFRS
jgi:hypothetical protein